LELTVPAGSGASDLGSFLIAVPFSSELLRMVKKEMGWRIPHPVLGMMSALFRLGDKSEARGFSNTD
jgi:hypothetical protein